MGEPKYWRFASRYGSKLLMLISNGQLPMVNNSASRMVRTGVVAANRVIFGPISVKKTWYQHDAGLTEM